jgi:hypothetical protein
MREGGVLMTLKEKKSIPCLCCGMKFASEGIHNRMCESCKVRDYSPMNNGRRGWKKKVKTMQPKRKEVGYEFRTSP